MIPREIVLFPGLRLYTTYRWLVQVVKVTDNDIVQWVFVDSRTPHTYGAPLEWVYRAWSLA